MTAPETAAGESIAQKVQTPHPPSTNGNATTTNKTPVYRYGAYQMEVYGAGMLHGNRPTVTKDPNGLEEQAKQAMDRKAWAYIAGAAGERATLEANRLAFRVWKLIPRMLCPTTTRDLSVTLFGTTYPSPVLCAPVGVQKLFHHDGEVGVAEVMAQIGVPYIASTASSNTLEDIAQANEKAGGKRWFQLYWPQTKSITESLLNRAKAAGYEVLVVTLDTWAMGYRPFDLDTAYVPFLTGLGNDTGFTDPAFREMFSRQSFGKTPEDDVFEASRAWIGDVFSGAAHSWEDLAHVREHWEGPIVLKGIQHADDALKAYECGMDGVVVSNHGGRQCDGAVGSLDMLPEIIDAVKGKPVRRGDKESKFTVLFDSGIRTGTDIIKVMCLGADGVLVGRPWVYGLGIAGKKGAQDVMRGILCDLDQSMGLSGIPSIKDCHKARLKRVEYPGDRHSNN